MVRNHYSASNEPPSFDVLFKRMLGNWSVPDPEVRNEKAKMFRELHAKVGGTRFAAGVAKAIEQHYSPFFPSFAEFVKYIPERKIADPGGLSDADKARIKAEQETPEYKAAMAKLDATLKHANSLTWAFQQRKIDAMTRVEVERKKVQSFREKNELDQEAK